MLDELLLTLGLVLAASFTVINGFHDASNAVALPVRFNALTPRVALWMGAVFNLAGVLAVGFVLHSLIPFDIPVPIGSVGTVVLLVALLTAIGWDLLTWWWAMPSSSTGAIGGGILGALFGAELVDLVPDLSLGRDTFWILAPPIVLAPLIAFILARLLVAVAVFAVRHDTPARVKSRSNLVQATGSALIHFGHGIQHGRRAIWVFTMLLLCAGIQVPVDELPVWITLAVAVGLAGGTLLGGWRIAYTLSSRLVSIDPLRGAVAQTVSGALLFVGGFIGPITLSTSQTASAAILGAGTGQRFRTLYHRTLVRVLLTWLLTVPACALVAGILFLAASPLLTHLG